ncbi:FAD-binding protein [Patulibacter brassicae]|jgi:FAD/FMN-containing dehydrogenase|uniref:FAD-binding protein n=1 Tax=Patulibacter brassicae TaxID=1705717 RepID=A0ABU4VHL2_9ACTN|nr:FAD-binding protein [Patulibacter brassicae]MDX8150393.1 FAD-binding protein [Patulibacter brassicae]
MTPPSTLPLLAPGDPHWDAARATFNPLADQRPALLARPATLEQLREAVLHAAATDLRIAPQGTGHGAASLPALDDVLLLRTDALDRVLVDPRAGTATFGGGARAGAVGAAAALSGGSVASGFSPTVGLTGFLLGGGLGWFARRDGFGAASVVGARIVTAEGVLRRVDDAHDPELLRALRGGGGGFGVVGELTVRLGTRRVVEAGALAWPVERAGEVLAAWQALLPELDEDVTSCLHLVAFPPAPAVPAPLRGRAMVLVESVDASGGLAHPALLGPLRALDPELDTFRATAVGDLGDLHGDPRDPVPTRSRHALLDVLPDALVDRFVEAAAVGRSSLVSVELRHLGGALARPDARLALEPVAAPLALFALGVAPDPPAVASVDAQLDELVGVLAPVAHERRLPTFSEQPVAPERLFGPDRLAELRRTRRRLDPAERLVPSHPLGA